MKEEQYKLLVSQIASLIEGEKDIIAVMSNVAAAIHQTMGSGGRDSIESTMRSWFLVHSKAPSPVCTSHTARACVARPGKEQRPSLYQMLSSSLAI